MFLQSAIDKTAVKSERNTQKKKNQLQKKKHFLTIGYRSVNCTFIEIYFTPRIIFDIETAVFHLFANHFFQNRFDRIQCAIVFTFQVLVIQYNSLNCFVAIINILAMGRDKMIKLIDLPIVAFATKSDGKSLASVYSTRNCKMKTQIRIMEKYPLHENAMYKAILVSLFAQM